MTCLKILLDVDSRPSPPLCTSLAYEGIYKSLSSFEVMRGHDAEKENTLMPDRAGFK